MLTVLMATHNGARTLGSVLAAYGALDAPSGGWKLVIVDNGSTDATREVIASFASRLPLAYKYEPRPGQNVARNAGLAHVTGDLVVFSDDDTVPRNDWLVQMRTIADTQRSFALFGGTVLPSWERSPESWITEWNVPIGFTFSLTDPALPDGPINPVLVFSPNMAIRSAVFANGHRFDETIGPDGSDNYAMGSETELLVRLSQAGCRAWHCRASVVEHIVPASHINKQWVLRRAFRYGRGHFRREVRDWRPVPPTLVGVPRYLIRSIVRQYLGVVYALCLGDERAVFAARLELSYLLGRAAESRSMRRRRVMLSSTPPASSW